MERGREEEMERGRARDGRGGEMKDAKKESGRGEGGPWP